MISHPFPFLRPLYFILSLSLLHAHSLFFTRRWRAHVHSDARAASLSLRARADSMSMEVKHDVCKRTPVYDCLRIFDCVYALRHILS